MPPSAKPASPRQIAEEKQTAFLSELGSKLRDVTEKLNDIDRRIAPLKDKRKILASERDRLKRLMYDTPTFETRTGMGQGLYVHTRYFLPYVNEWIARYGFGGQAALARKANISAKNIRSYNDGKITYAGFVTVDRLLTAMERMDLLDRLPFKTAVELKLNSNKPTTPPAPPPNKYYED